MGKNKEKSFQSIVTIDNYNHRSYIFKSDVMRPLEKLQFKSHNYYTTFIANKDLIIAPLSISRNIEDEDVPGALEDKAYDELGLDPATEYLFQYQEIAGDGEGRVFQVFILERVRYEELFENLRQTIKYVDLIVPAPLLYQSLYDRNLLENKKVHCFLYFTHYDTTLTFYRNGEYLYSKSVQYSLKQIYDRYCEIAGKTVDEKQFFRIFQKEGVKTTHLEFQQNLSKLFNEIFITINDIVIYTKRAYKVDVIDVMYIGSELGPISGVDEYAQNYLGLYSRPFLFDFKVKSDEWYVDQYHYMLADTAKRYLEDPESIVNFTQNPRPPVFYKRASGQFILSLIAGILLASAYPVYYLVGSYILDLKNYQLTKEEKQLDTEVSKYKAILGKKKAEMKHLDSQIAQLKRIYEGKERTLISVYNKKVNYRLKSNQLAALAEELSKYGLNSDEMMSHNDRFAVSLIANSDRNITSLVKDVTNKYASEIKRIDIEHISADENSSLYRGVLKVDFK
ncbi:hypothetical protein [Nitratifractor salsuginis]|uniref:Uncharacterized protein n=1 Tax=Nitratifractor salsuginis (strain DSM 16511 / JCM 12458 / E9I37-1) TaxID=749222 RepID=E6X1X2_NITSE|nr:hypothetical protein [Nitratifractor salsuginis]ADV45980.1 hypothetical protein Nitsa_0713 [Nitratifractor salsuginis DSM 16511]